MLMFSGEEVDEFEESVLMSTYLVAFVVIVDYDHVTNKTESGIEVSPATCSYKCDVIHTVASTVCAGVRLRTCRTDRASKIRSERRNQSSGFL